MAPHTQSTSAFPHPHVRWKRGTELLSPCTPRSAQFTTGKKRTPCDFSQPPTSSRARATYCSAQRRGHSSDSSKSAIRIQSSSASSTLSGIRERRCSEVSAMNIPPNAPPADPADPLGLAAVDQQDVAAVLEQLERGHEPRDSRAYDDHVCRIRHAA